MPKILITNNNKKKILDIILSWRGKLSWSLLCERVTKELDLKNKVSRHTLLAYEEIKIAFENKKEWLKENPNPSYESDSTQLQDAYSRIDKLDAKVRCLEMENTALKEQLVRWQYNLYLMGNNMDMLNKELPNQTNIEELRVELEQKPIPSNVDMSKLNQPMSKLTRANDNRRHRARTDEFKK